MSGTDTVQPLNLICPAMVAAGLAWTRSDWTELKAPLAFVESKSGKLVGGEKEKSRRKKSWKGREGVEM